MNDPPVLTQFATAISAIDSNLDGLVACGAADGSCVLVSAQTHTTPMRFSVSGPVTVLRLSPTRLLLTGGAPARGALAVASGAGALSIWEICPTSVRCSRRLFGHNCSVSCMEWTSFSGIPVVVSGSHDGTVRVWHALSGACVQLRLDSPLPPPRSRVLCLTVLDGLVAVGYSCGKLRHWRLGRAYGSSLGWDNLRPNLVCEASAHTGSTLFIAAEANTSSVVTGGEDGNLCVWSLDGALLQTLRGHREAVSCLHMCCGALASGSRDSTLRVWSPRSGSASQSKFPTSFDCTAVLGACSSPPTYVSFTAAGLLSVSEDGQIRLWAIANSPPTSTALGSVVSLGVATLACPTALLTGADGALRMWMLPALPPPLDPLEPPLPTPAPPLEPPLPTPAPPLEPPLLEPPHKSATTDPIEPKPSPPAVQTEPSAAQPCAQPQATVVQDPEPTAQTVCTGAPHKKQGCQTHQRCQCCEGPSPHVSQPKPRRKFKPWR
eukprot:gnl/Spiro4/12377_TR6531_c0_g1_i1.p1 gnl/Spiro4/12377_TR6531_c0_g1~~gnl/Spiro4/12377_TR6531_c0_g1_i1.p1  ORF type:complete len:492 (+),score=81.44 gnl/Spiro4/12377_TR6531_c0_g1_i1:109-1584(+)